MPHIGYVTAENYSIFYTQMIEALEVCVNGKPIRECMAMRSRSLSFLLKSKYKFLRKIYFFYNIYIRNFKFLKKSSQFNEEIFLLKYFKNYKKG